MSSTDDRIVRMQFDNAQFKRGAKETKDSLDSVNKSIDSAGSGKGLLNLDEHIKRVASSASKMSLVMSGALLSIGSRVANTGLAMASALTLDPIKSGFQEYEALLNKQKVLMNATGESAAHVKKTLNELNRYSDKTIFSFADMTEGMTYFVNAGIKLPEATAAMKGIANASALAGASTLEAQSSFRAFGQAMGQGFLGLQDWRQAAVTGKIGTIQFKQAVIDAGVAVGTLKKVGDHYVTTTGKATIVTAKTFDQTLQKQWVSTKVLTKALGEFGNENTKLGKKAFEAATQVRTFHAFMDTLKESLGSGWGQIFTALFGGLDDSTKMWTGLSNAIGGTLNNVFNFLSGIIQTWRDMGGFKKTMEGFKNILAPIGALFSTIGKAWRAAFPKSESGAGSALYGLSNGFALLTSPLKLLAKLITLLQGPLTNFFLEIKIGGQIIGLIIGWVKEFVGHLFSLVSFKMPSGGGGILGFFSTIAGAITAALQNVSHFLDRIKSAKSIFSGFKIPGLGGGGSKVQNVQQATVSGAKGAVKGAKAAITGAAPGIESGASSAISAVGDGMSNVGDAAAKGAQMVVHAGKAMINAIIDVAQWFKKILGKINFNDVIQSFNMAVLSSFVISMTRMFNSLSKGFKSFGEIGDGVGEVLEGAGKGLKSFQTAAQAKLVLNMAIAVGVLAASLWVLSKIPHKDLVFALAALSGVFVGLSLVLKSLAKAAEAMDGKGMGLKLLALSVGVLAIASAMFILAAALILFKLVKWESIGKAAVVLTAVTYALSAMAVVAGLFEAPMVGLGIALVALSTGMLIMAAALIAFQLVKWESIGKAAVVLDTLTVALTAMAAVAGLFEAPLFGLAAALVAFSIALNGLAIAGLLLDHVSWESIGKIAVLIGILTVASIAFMAVLGLIALVLAPLGPALLLVGAAFFLMGVGVLAFAAGLAIALPLLAAGGAAFAAFAVAAAVAIGVFLQTLASEAPVMKDSMLKILQAVLDGIVAAVPMIIQAIKDLVRAIFKELFGGGGGGSSSGGTVQAGMSKGGASWITSLWHGITKVFPKLVKDVIGMVLNFLGQVAGKAKDFAVIGLTFIINFLNGLTSKIGNLISAGVNFVVAILNGIGSQLPKLVAAAGDLMLNFLTALGNWINANGERVGTVMEGLAENIIKGLVKGIEKFAQKALDSVGNLAKSMINKAKDIFSIFSPSRVFASIGMFLVLGLTKGVQDNAVTAITAVASMTSGAIAVASEYVSRFVQKLDQQAIAARAKADGLAKAAQIATDAANKTKSKVDDVAAAKLQQSADAADKAATVAEDKAQKAKDQAARSADFEKASSIDKAKMKSEDAQASLDAAKASELNAESLRTEAAALRKQAKVAGVTTAQKRAFEAQAKELDKKAAAQANQANVYLDSAKSNAASALDWQKKAGAEAAAAFQASFDANAQAAADTEAFNKLNNQEKADLRRKQAEDLQAKAQKDLDAAKVLAFTDLEAANALAQQAQDEANQARQYLTDAKGFDPSGGGGPLNGTVVNLTPSDTASVAMDVYAGVYDAATAAAATQKTVQFTQYNTSPEALSPTEVYRQTNNLFTYAADKIDAAA